MCRLTRRHFRFPKTIAEAFADAEVAASIGWAAVRVDRGSDAAYADAAGYAANRGAPDAGQYASESGSAADHAHRSTTVGPRRIAHAMSRLLAEDGVADGPLEHVIRGTGAQRGTQVGLPFGEEAGP